MKISKSFLLYKIARESRVQCLSGRVLDYNQKAPGSSPGAQVLPEALFYVLELGTLSGKGPTTTKTGGLEH